MRVTVSTADFELPEIRGEYYVQNPETGEWEKYDVTSGATLSGSYSAGRAELSLWLTKDSSHHRPEPRVLVVDDIDAEFF